MNMPDSPTRRAAGSFRDPSGRVYIRDGRVLRYVSAAAQADWETLMASGLLERLQERELVPSSHHVPPGGVDPVEDIHVIDVVEHEPIPFVSYPYEWSFGMLRDASLLILEVLDEALQRGMTVKDGTSYNVQFVGSRPVFIDVLSFARHSPGSTWAGYRQFCQLALYPLLLTAYKGVPFHPWLRGALDGIEPAFARGLFGLRDALRPGVLVDVMLQTTLERLFGAYPGSIKAEIERSPRDPSAVRRTVARLRRIVSSLTCPDGFRSAWVAYPESRHYGEDDLAIKQRFVAHALARIAPLPLVYDIGCNVGEYSLLAARHSDYVVAVDADHASIDTLYSRLRQSGPPNILPLVQDAIDPSPAQGWQLAERLDFFARARPDAVLLLALIHHLVIGRNVPLGDITTWLADIGSCALVEFVTKDDPGVQQLLRNKADHYAEYNQDTFERHLARRFHTLDRVVLPMGTRVLYLLQRRNGSATTSS